MTQKLSKCLNCKGTGKVPNKIPVHDVLNRICPVCEGAGKMLPSENRKATYDDSCKYLLISATKSEGIMAGENGKL